MAILAGLDVHRAQITFDALNTDTGGVLCGRMRGDREAVGEWVQQFASEEVEVALEACTGWLFVYEVLVAAGAGVHLAEPAETSALRGKKRQAKTDRAAARWLRTLLVEGRLPQAWIAPAHVREWRTKTRLRKTLIDECTCWLQRIQATLFTTASSTSPTNCCAPTDARFCARSSSQASRSMLNASSTGANGMAALSTSNRPVPPDSRGDIEFVDKQHIRSCS
jgi:hypothetical protein